MKIKIVVDSACDLPQKLIDQNKIAVIPMFINMQMQSYRDGVDISRQDFYQRILKTNEYPTTSAPGPELFKAFYDRLADEGVDQILSIHLSHNLSSVLEMARRSASEYKKIPVRVFDSKQLSMGAGFLALTAAQAAVGGANIDEILNLLNDQVKRTHVFAALDTLDFLSHSGRMSGVVAKIGNLLQIKPILRMYDGTPTSEKIRTKGKALNRLLAIYRSLGEMEKTAILHGNIPEQMEYLVQNVLEKSPDIQIVRAEISPTLAAHIGPRAAGFACVTRI